MSRKTDFGKEIDERADYFAEWAERLSDDRDKEKVVNEKTANEFLKEAFSRDHSLSNLVEGMEAAGKNFDAIIKTSYIQDLIEANRLGKKLDVATARLKKKRESLEKMIPKRQGVVRKKVINKFTTATMLKKYNIHKDDKGRYHDSRSGRFVSNDKILRITDLVILSSAKKRKEFDVFMEKIRKK